MPKHVLVAAAEGLPKFSRRSILVAISSTVALTAVPSALAADPVLAGLKAIVDLVENTPDGFVAVLCPHGAYPLFFTSSGPGSQERRDRLADSGCQFIPTSRLPALRALIAAHEDTL